MSAQPDQIIRFRTTNGGKDTVCHARKININIRLHNVVYLNSFFTLSIRVYVCEHKSDASDTQAESSLPSRP